MNWTQEMTYSLEDIFANQVSISPDFYQQRLHAQIRKAQKIESCHQSFFALLESGFVKAARKMLMKLIPEHWSDAGCSTKQTDSY